MGTKKTYRVVYTPDEDGVWVASVAGVQGVHTQGRTLERARERVVEALAAAGIDTSAVALKHDVRLPNDVRAAIDLAKHARAEAEQVNAKAQAAMRAAAKALTRGKGLSVRDAAEVLGVSHQRVQQLLTVTVVR